MSNDRRYPRRLIEVDLPIKEISAHARREKSIRHGHISTLHIWWARRPLAACRAMILAALWPDPADTLCPERFRVDAAEVMKEWRNRRGGPQRNWDDPAQVRAALLDFIADFANWDNSTSTAHLGTARRLVQVAHESLGGAPGTRPLVVDPFAGGGAIPLESLRVGADAFASDLNPVAVLMNRVSVELIPKDRERLANAVRMWGRRVNETAAKDLAALYPRHPDGATPIAYLWARTIKCEGPACGAEVPLLRSLWLARKGNRLVALRLERSRSINGVEFKIVEGAQASSVGVGTVARGSATCTLCGYTTRVERVRAQLRERHGGTQDARLYCSVVKTPAGTTAYRTPTSADIQAVERSRERYAALARSGTEFGTQELPPDGALGFRVQKYGITKWREVFTHRQMLVLSTYASIIRALEIADEPNLTISVRTLLGLTISKMANFTSSLCAWRNARSCVRNTFGSQTLSMVWDFGEMNPYAGSAGDFSEGLDYLDKFIAHVLGGVDHEGVSNHADAASIPLPDDSASLFFTDPPYYDAIPYGHLSGYFATWLEAVGVLPNDLDGAASSIQECIVDRGLGKSAAFFEDKMSDCLRDGRRVAHPQSLGVVVFAHKSTSGWETQLQAMLDAGWIVTASWPIDTERAGRLRAIDSAALASSVHLVCRPREHSDGRVQNNDVGDWRAVLRDLPVRIHEWMPRLAKEGVVGADAIFACLGPALEIFSRYSRVEKASGDRVELREYLEQVWAAVAKEAFALIFSDGDATDLEPDARLTAIWFWALHVERNGSKGAHTVVDPEANVDNEGPGGINEDNSVSPKNARKPPGYTMEFDTARKLAQGLGVHLETLAGQKGILEIKGSLATIRPVSDRSSSLLGAQGSLFEFGNREGKWRSRTQGTGSEKVKMKAAVEREEPLFDVQREPVMPVEQRTLPGFFPPDTRTVVERLVDGGRTTLDRLHQTMLLFGRGQTSLIGPMLVTTGMASQPAFWKLAQSLSALYPAGTDEKRWVDGVLARKKGLGFG